MASTDVVMPTRGRALPSDADVTPRLAITSKPSYHGA
ncbi:hypothetical protein DSM107133_03061 [Pseudosulfitobacter sp. DSM 107133]|nr:hypothetical protein DSM107133_03061 [Pseudosulfitobacter sp. DSM 107133]